MKRNWTAARKTLGVGLVGAGLAWGLAAQLRGDTWRAHAAAQVSSSQAASQADAPNFQNAKVETRTVQGLLNEEVRRWAEGESKARWLGYAVTGVKGKRSICCSDYTGSERCGRCALEDHRSGVSINSSDEKTGKVRLEGPPQMAVMYRAENGKIGRVRIFSLQCTADAGGLNVLWFEGVNANQSVKVLEKFVTNGEEAGDDNESISKNALTALALHGDPSADGALESFAAPNRPEWLRRETAFWLGEARGAEGLRALEKMAKTDPSPPVREQVAFALSVSSEPGALTEMIRMAREDSDGQVRGQALFWLAQKAGKKAESAVTGAIQNDPDTDVKKKAVFALSQMPQDEGVPKLIEVATTNRNLEVRKQAMFWLGQSDDPRALEFFEKVLSH